MENSFTVVNGITLAIAVLGAVLGLINTLHTFDKSRVKLRVVPKHAIPVSGFDPSVTVCIEVTNLSTFALTISEVGFLYRCSTKRSVIITPILIDGGSWPRRLEPRSSVTVYGHTPQPIPGITIKCAYAETDCGHLKTGNSPALKQIAAGK